MRAWPAPGSAAVSSTTVRTSGPPYAVATTTDDTTTGNTGVVSRIPTWMLVWRHWRNAGWTGRLLPEWAASQRAGQCGAAGNVGHVPCANERITVEPLLASRADPSPTCTTALNQGER